MLLKYHSTSVLTMIFGSDSKSKATKAKINKQDYIKLKSFSQKGKLWTKWKPTYWMGENICKSYIWQGVNIQNMQKPHNSIARKTSNNPIQKQAEDLKRHFSKEDIQVANRHMKRCPTSLIIKEIQIKPQWAITSHLSEWLLLKRQK